VVPTFNDHSAYYYNDEVGQLQVLLEEVTRARPGSPKARFIMPQDEVVSRLSSNFHHVLYGRRGTGKSSLLRHIESARKESGHLIAWADQETFKGLSYPDVLVGTLAEVFSQIAVQLEGRSPSAPSRSWYGRRRPPTPEQTLAQELENAVHALQDLQKAPSESEIEWTENHVTESNVTAGGGIKGSDNRGIFSFNLGGTKGFKEIARRSCRPALHREKGRTFRKSSCELPCSHPCNRQASTRHFYHPR
jgi:hypothetical protein